MTDVVDAPSLVQIWSLDATGAPEPANWFGGGPDQPGIHPILVDPRHVTAGRHLSAATRLIRRGLIALAALFATLAIAPSSASAPVGVAIVADASEAGTRVVLTHDAPVGYTIREESGRIEIDYERAVAIQGESPRLANDTILRRVRNRGERTLVLTLGPKFESYETFELKNPLRLVVDLHAKRSADRRDASSGRAPEPTRVIVLDPGHGGIEQGAVGPTGLDEKEVTLDIARRLRLRLSSMKPKPTVVLTRDEDRVLALDERTAVANHNRADLFLSIHVNSSPRSSATGAETYFLAAEASDDEARMAAALENRGSTEVAQRNLDLVLWELAQTQFLAESAALAEAVQRQLNLLTGTRDRGVRQAPFRVLTGAQMAAVLVEVGFISNPAEETKLRSSEYREQIVSALAAAVGDFLARAERLDAPAPVPSRSAAPVLP